MIAQLKAWNKCTIWPLKKFAYLFKTNLVPYKLTPFQSALKTELSHLLIGIILHIIKRIITHWNRFVYTTQGNGTDRLVQKWIASTIHLYFGKWLFIIHDFFSIFSWNYALSNEGILNGYGLWAVLVSKRVWILIYDFHRLILLRID